MDRLKKAVRRLNDSPLHLELTLYDIESKSETELVRFIGSIISRLEVSFPLPEFLRFAACPLEFDAASRLKLYDILVWLAEHLTVILQSKAVYQLLEPVVLSTPLVGPGTESFEGLVNRITEQQNELTLLHTRFLEADSHCGRMHAQEARVMELNADESVLTEKIAKAMRKMKGSNGFEAILKRTKNIRILSAEIDTWTERESELSTSLSNLEHSLQEEAWEVELIGELIGQHSQRILEAIQLKARDMRLVLNTYVGELDKAQTMREKLEILLSKVGIFDTEIQMMEERIAQLSKDTEDKRNQLTQLDPSATANEKMLLYYQQYKLTRSKHYALIADRMKLESEGKRSAQRLRKEQADYLTRTGSTYVSEEDLNSLIGLVRELGIDYKRLRSLNSELSAELEVLESTVSMLSAELKSLTSSAACASRSLAEVSAQAEEVNLSKEAAINELSTIAKEMAVKLRAKEAVLGPKLADMEQRQRDFDSLNERKMHQQELLEKERGPFRLALSNHETEKQLCMQTFSDILKELGETQTELDRFHSLKAEIDINKAIISRQPLLLSKETELRILEGRLNDAESRRNPLVPQYFQTVIAALEQRQTSLSSYLKSHLPHSCLLIK